MSLLQGLILGLGLFYVHHMVQWQRRRGIYGLVRLQKLARAKSFLEIERLASRLNNHPHCSLRLRSAVLRCRGWARLCSGRPKEAGDDVALALEWNPKDGRAYLAKAMVCWHSQPEEALRALTQARRWRELWNWTPVRREISLFQGLALTRLGRGEEALKCFAAFPIPPKPALQKYKAQALALSGKYQESLELFAAAGEEDARLALAGFLLSVDRHEESLFWLNRTLSEQRAGLPLFLKASVLMHLGKERESEDCLQEWQAIVLRPGDYVLYPELTDFGRGHLTEWTAMLSEKRQHWN